MHAMKLNIYKNKCCLCKNPSALTRICIQDNYQVLAQLKVFKNIFTRYNPYSFLRICDICKNEMKLRMFVKCDAENYLEEGMQESSQHIEDTNCQCDHCKEKFGNLPLLAEVVERVGRGISTEKTEPDDIKTDSNEQNAPLNYSIKNLNNSIDTQPSTSKQTSTNRKVMICEHCDKSFTHKGDMKKHLRKHTGEKPYSCSVCNRKFAHTSNLARHLKVHSGDKPFNCDRCKKSFSRKDKLVMHQKTKLCMNFGNNSQSNL